MNLTTPLSLLPETQRAGVAHARVNLYAMGLTNAALRAADFDQKQRALHQAVAIVGEAVMYAVHQHVEPDRVAALRAEAEKLLREIAPEDSGSLPRRRTLDVGRFAVRYEFLDVVASALAPVVDTSRLPGAPRVDWAAVERACQTGVAPRKEANRARVVALAILGWLLNVDALAESFPRPVRPDTVGDDIERLTGAIGVLLAADAANVVNVARVVMYVFGVGKDETKNLGDVLESWEQRQRAPHGSPPTSSGG